MATKLRKQQKQKRWAGSGLAAPEEYRAEVRRGHVLPGQSDAHLTVYFDSMPA